MTSTARECNPFDEFKKFRSRGSRRCFDRSPSCASSIVRSSSRARFAVRARSFLAVRTVATGIRAHRRAIVSRSQKSCCHEAIATFASFRKPFATLYAARVLRKRAIRDVRPSLARLFLLPRGRKAIALIARRSVLAAVLSDLQHPAVIEKCTRRRSPRTSRRSSPQRR